jgi:hypothetical protein
MGAVQTPYGLYPRKCYGSRRHTAGCTHFPVTADPGGTIYYGGPVALVSGSVKPVAATPTSTGSASSPCGVLQGAYWEDRSGVHFSPHLPAGLIAGGAKRIVAMVNDDPDLWFMVQASATLDLTAVGKLAAILNPAAGNASSGRSTAALDAASVATTGTLACRIVRVLDPGAPFPDVLVQFGGTVHQYLNNFSS